MKVVNINNAEDLPGGYDQDMKSLLTDQPILWKITLPFLEDPTYFCARIARWSEVFVWSWWLLVLNRDS